MKKNIRFVLAGLLTATMVIAPMAGIAQDKPKTPPTPPAGSAPEKSAPAARAVPFRGAVTAVDKAAKTVTVGKLVFQISSETKLMKGTQAVTIADINVGEMIGGNYTKGDDGKLTAKTIRFVPKPSQAEQSDKKPVEKKKAENAE